MKRFDFFLIGLGLLEGNACRRDFFSFPWNSLRVVVELISELQCEF